jgi:small subunit ribosomal protein S9
MPTIKKTTKPKKEPKGAKKLKKKIAPKKVAKTPVKTPIKKPARFLEAIGRRKTAVARIRLWTRGEIEFLINDKPYKKYFPTLELQEAATASLKKMKCLDRFRILVKVKGGGINGQAEAVRHGTARVLTLFNPDFQKRLRKVGYLTRDSRMRERKKFGLKRARRAPQWAKR